MRDLWRLWRQAAAYARPPDVSLPGRGGGRPLLVPISLISLSPVENDHLPNWHTHRRPSISPSGSSDTTSSKSSNSSHFQSTPGIISRDKPQNAKANRIYPNQHLYPRSDTTASSTSSENKSGQQSQRCLERRLHGRSKRSRTSRASRQSNSSSSNISLSQQYQLQTFLNAPSSLNWEELVESLKSEKSGNKIINSTVEIAEDDDVSLLDNSRSGGTLRVDRSRDMDDIEGGRSGKSLADSVDSVDSDDSDDSDDDQDSVDSLGSIVSSPSDELQMSEEAPPIHLLAQQRDSECYQQEESSVQDRESCEPREITTHDRLRQMVAKVVTDQVDEQLTEHFSTATISTPTTAENPIDESAGLVGGRGSAFNQVSPTSTAVHLMSSGHTERDDEIRQSQSLADGARCHLPVHQDFQPLQPQPMSPRAQFEQIMVPQPISSEERRGTIVELGDPPLWLCEDNLEANCAVACDGDTGSSNMVLSPRVEVTRRLDNEADDGSNERAQVVDMERDESDSSVEPCEFEANWEVFEASTLNEHAEEFERSPCSRNWDAFDEPEHDGGGALNTLDSSCLDSQNDDDSTVVVENTVKLSEIRLSPQRVATKPRVVERIYAHDEAAPLVILPRSLSVNRKDPTCLQVTIHRMRRTKAEF